MNINQSRSVPPRDRNTLGKTVSSGKIEAGEKSAELLYADIIDLPHHVSRTHPPMPMLNRAAQFAPFAALTGYDAAVEETARLTEDEVYLDTSEIEVLNEKLTRIENLLPQHPEVQITYFLPDEKKAGGSYETTAGPVKKIDHIAQNLLMESDERIPFARIIAIEIL